MKGGVLLLIGYFLLVPVLNCFAAPNYRIEILQVANIEPYEASYQGFIEELKKGGFVDGKNIAVNRHIIDADADASIWEKISILFKLKKLAGKVADSKPDLVLTIGTVTSKYSMGKFIDAGIPVVFTAVANPLVLGCKDIKTPGKGFTGSSLYLDPIVALTLTQMVCPKVKTLGMICSDDENGITFIEETKRKSPSLGITVISKQVKKSASILPAVSELHKAGADAFGVPLDTYYGLRDNEPCRELDAFCKEKKIPVFVFIGYQTKGGTLYVGSDFNYIGKLAAAQSMKILTQKVKPETLPILKQDDLLVYYDQEKLDLLGLKLPPQIQKIARKAVFKQ